MAGRTYYGQPAVAGTVNTKYNGTYSAAAARTPYGGYNTAVAGPYGGRVTTTLPSGYRTTTYYGRSYYTYGGTYYRPYTYGGVHYYYPVPPPYYSYYSYPPPGATIVIILGVTYLVSQDGHYCKQTTTSDGKTTYQAVPAPQGAAMAGVAGDARARERHRHDLLSQRQCVLPARDERRAGIVRGGDGTSRGRLRRGTARQLRGRPAEHDVLQGWRPLLRAVPLARRRGDVRHGGRAAFAAIRCPGGFGAQRPTPPAPAAAKAPVSAPGTTPAAPAAAPVRAVVERLEAPAGTVLVVRLATEVSSATAQVGNRFHGFLDQDVAANGRMMAPRGTKVFGVVSAVDSGSKMKGQPTLSVTLTDIEVGGRVLPIKTQPLNASGGTASGAKKLVGGAAVGATIGAIAGGGEGAAIGAAVGTGVGGAAAAGSSVKASRHCGADPAGVHPGGATAAGDHDERGRALSRRGP